MGNVREWFTLSRTAPALLCAAALMGALTVVAAAREPEPAATEATIPPPAFERLAEAPTAAGSSASTSAATTTTAASFDPGLEGAIEAPSEEHAPPIEAVAAASSRESSGRFSMPLAGWTAVTDRYGAARGGGLIHGGIDLALDTARHSPVYSACAGRVATATYNATYGNHVIVDCGDGWSTLYGHLSEIRLSPGASVTPTSILGISGSTGFSTGEHLHFEIRWNGTPVNPESYLDFHIAPGTPLSSGPIVIARPGSGQAGTPGSTGAATAEASPTPEPTATPIPPTPTATRVPPTATPTNTATPTPTPTRRPPPPTATPLSAVR